MITHNDALSLAERAATQAAHDILRHARRWAYAKTADEREQARIDGERAQRAYEAAMSDVRETAEAIAEAAALGRKATFRIVTNDAA